MFRFVTTSGTFHITDTKKEKTERKKTFGREQKQGLNKVRSKDSKRQKKGTYTNEGERYKKSDRNRGKDSRDRREKR